MCVSSNYTTHIHHTIYTHNHVEREREEKKRKKKEKKGKKKKRELGKSNYKVKGSH